MSIIGLTYTLPHLYPSAMHLDLHVRCLEKVPKMVSQMVKWRLHPPCVFVVRCTSFRNCYRILLRRKHPSCVEHLSESFYYFQETHRFEVLKCNSLKVNQHVKNGSSVWMMINSLLEKWWLVNSMDFRCFMIFRCPTFMVAPPRKNR